MPAFTSSLTCNDASATCTSVPKCLAKNFDRTPRNRLAAAIGTVAMTKKRDFGRPSTHDSASSDRCWTLCLRQLAQRADVMDSRRKKTGAAQQAYRSTSHNRYRFRYPDIKGEATAPLAPSARAPPAQADRIREVLKCAKPTRRMKSDL